MSTPYSRARPRSETTLRVEALLGRYPDLGERELAELIDLFPKLRILDHGLMTADSRLSDRLARFEREHRNALRAPLSSLAVFLFVPATLAIVTLLFMLG